MSPSSALDHPKTLHSPGDKRPQPRRYHSTSVFYNSPLASSSAGLSFAGLPDSPSPVNLRTSYFAGSPGGFSSSRDPTTPSSSAKRGSNLFFPHRAQSYHGGSVSSPLSTSTPLKQQPRAAQVTTEHPSPSCPTTPPPCESTSGQLNTSVRSTRSTRSAFSTRSGDLSDSPLMDLHRSPTPSDRSSAGPTPILVRPGRLPTGTLGRMTGSQPSTPVPSTPVPTKRKPSKGIMFMPGKGRPTASSYTGGTPSGAKPTVAISTAVATASPSTSKSISPTEAHEKKVNTKHRRASSGASLNSFVSASSSLRASAAPRTGKGVKTATAPPSVASDVPIAPHTTGALADIQPTSAVGSFGVEARLATEALENATGGTGRIEPSPQERIEDDRMSELSSVISSLHVMDEPVDVAESASVTSYSTKFNTAPPTPSSDRRNVKSSSMEELPSDVEPELCEVDETVHEIITDGYGNGYIDVVPDTEYIPPYQPRKSHFASMAQHAPQIWAITLSCSVGPTDLPLNRRRVELDIFWAPLQGVWEYVPFARYIPSWKLRLASGTSGKGVKAIAPASPAKGKGKAHGGKDGADEGGAGELAVRDERISFAREVARAVISRLPLLSRFSAWV